MRLAKARSMQRAFDRANPHQQIPDQQFANDLLYGVSHAERRDDVSLCPNEAPLSTWLDRILAEQHGQQGETYRLDLGLVEQSYWRLPNRLLSQF